MSELYFCPNCRVSITYGSRYCTNCGIKLDWPVQQVIPESCNNPGYFNRQQEWRQQPDQRHNQYQCYAEDDHNAGIHYKDRAASGTATLMRNEIIKLIADFLDRPVNNN